MRLSYDRVVEELRQRGGHRGNVEGNLKFGIRNDLITTPCNSTMRQQRRSQGSSSAALSFLLLPLLPPASRARRRDLRRLATGKIPRASEGWEGRVYSRLSVLPDAAAPLQRSKLLAALSVGCEIIRLRIICRRLDLGSGLDNALEALAGANSAAVVTKLANLDDALKARPGTAILRARAGLLAISEALTEHAAYFDAVAPK